MKLGGVPRFIPAYAGNTVQQVVLIISSPVHPRIRGEHSPVRKLSSAYSGSSPHTRGTPRKQSSAKSLRRFIPAYAGNTSCQLGGAQPRTVHPRIRGEHNAHSILEIHIFGSSPHTRGTPCWAPSPRPPWRFIPAYAGNTYTPDSETWHWTVHPRIRGEHIKP